jgi:hypothetical protein
MDKPAMLQAMVLGRHKLPRPLLGLFIWAIAFGSSGCNRAQPEDPKATESASERQSRWEKEADFAMRSACSNEIVGFHKIYRSDIDYAHSSNPGQWIGHADVDLVNKVGGIARRAFVCKFMVNSGALSAYSVRDVVEAKEQEAARHEIEAAAQSKADIANAQAKLLSGPHEWVFKKGGHFSATYVSGNSDDVTVSKAGKNYTLRFTELSEADQKLVIDIQQ